jgi:hypothetical protein
VLQHTFHSKAIRVGILVCAGASSLICQTGSVSGVVVGADGPAISAIVTANKKGAPEASGRVASAANGSFTISGLPDGTYELCASPKSGPYLDPCNWSPEIPRAQIAQGKPATGVRLVLDKGMSLQVRINDPVKLLETLPGPNKSAPHVLVGVFTERHTFQPLGLTGKDATGRDHQTTIPMDRDVSLHVFGRDVVVTDARGAAIDLAGTTIPLKRPAAGASPSSVPAAPITFTVAPKP